MVEIIIKYLSVITVAGAAISFVVGLFKYLDQRNQKERTKRFELFHDLMHHVSARGDGTNETLPLTTASCCSMNCNISRNIRMRPFQFLIRTDFVEKGSDTIAASY